jgi:predicted ATPase/class 3 adenylate cyclase
VPDLPTGTVTFLFTDIEGSTRLLQHIGDRYAQILADQRRLLRSAFQHRGGHEVRTEGDACFVAFPRAKDAVEAAVVAQRALASHPWPEGAEVRVRMGLHTGEPLRLDIGYIGVDVHQAARICSAGHGGQILISATTHALVAQDLPESASLRDLGEHRLKDLVHPHRLFQITVPDLPAAFPPLKSLSMLPNNLPIQLTSFIGREREIAEIKTMLATARLLTLTGAGGSGKTRLALEVGVDLLELYADGVWFADLAALADPGLVPQTVASALRVREQPGRPLTETLVDSLGPKSLLLLFDNCEHLLAACAGLADALLRACPNLQILATSREGLGIAGEALYPVPTFPVSDLERLPSMEDLSGYEAVRLFTERAAAVLPTFKVTPQNAKAVAQICHQLDGIPLAIELAAVRVKTLAVDQIVARLNDRFRLLTSGSRTALPRQQTLRAAIDWSYDLLSEPERVLLRRLAVFAGGWTLETAEAVCWGGSVNADDVLDLLTSLVDKSLVLAETQHGEARYRLLETVLQYNRDKLEESGEAGDLRRRHQDWYWGFAERATPKLTGPEQELCLERLETEHDNLRAALAWGRTDGESVETWLRLAGALHRFWVVSEHWSEGRSWVEEALTRGSEAQPGTLLTIVQGAVELAYRQGDYERAGLLAEQALGLSQTLKDKESIIWALTMSGLVIAERDPVHARTLLEESLALSRDLGDKWIIGYQLLQLADTVRALGDYERAATLCMESISLCREAGDKWRTAAGLRAMGIVFLRQREYGRAAAFYTESLPLCGRRNRWVSFQCLEGLGCVAFAQGHHERAAILFGAAEQLRESLRSRRDIDYLSEVDQYMNSTRTSLGDIAFAAAWAQGRAMTLEQAMEYALAAD